MRKIPVILLLAVFAMPAIYGQVKIGDNPQAISPTSVLELESNDRVLVITRINTAQMDAIVPNQGAMIYNTDTQCIHYYDGAQWINLCNSAGLVFTTDPIVNDVSTIVITDQAGTKNFEVAPNSIGSLQIINGGINGVDIQDGSIGQGKLQNQSVTQDKLSENSVGAFALDNANIDLGDFSNGPGFITGADIVSGDAGNNISVGGDNGAFYDNQPVLDAIGINTTDIQNHIAADADTNANNEIQTLALSGNDLSISLGNTITLPSTTGEIDDNELITNMVLNGSNELVITEGANPPVQVDLSPLAGGGTPDLSNVLTQGNDGGALQIKNILDPTDPQDAATRAYVDANVGGNQNLGQVLTQGNDGGTALIKNIGDPVDPQDAATRAYVDANVGGNQNLAQVLAQGTDGGAAPIKNILDPVDPQDAATRAYVDAAVTGGGSLTNGTILIGDAGNNPVEQIVGGDATLASDGTLTIENDAVNNAKIIDGAVTNNKISPGAADQILRTANDGLSVQWVDFPSGASVISDATLVGDGSSLATALGLADDAVNSAKIQNATIMAVDLNDMGANDGDVLEWDQGAGVWTPVALSAVSNEQDIALDITDNEIDLLEDDGTTVSSSVKLDGTTLDAINNGTDDVIQIADDGVNSAKIEDFSIVANDLNDMGATADGDILQWDTTANAGAGGWVVVANSAGHTGTANSIFFADNVTGAPITTETSPAPNDDGGLYWDPTKRFDSGALYVGLKPDSPIDSDGHSKVVIAERLTGGILGELALPLHIQNENGNNAGGAGVGILFAVEDNNTIDAFGRGALIYERTGAWGVGDFHFLQRTGTGVVNPDINDKSFTITSDKDIQLYRGLIASNGAGTAGQVLSSTGVGNAVQWVNAASGGGITATAAFTGDGQTGTPLDLADDAVTSAKIFDGAVANVDIAGDAITTDKIGAQEVGTTDLEDLGVTPAKIEPSVTDGEVLLTTGGAVAWGTVPAGAVNSDGSTIVGDGSTVDLSVPTGGITTNEILDATVANADIEPDAITSDKIGAQEVGTTDLEDLGVTPAKIEPSGTDGEVLLTTGGAVAWGTVPAGTVNSDGSTIVGDGSTVDLSVPTGGITTNEILDATVANADIEPDAITSDKIGAQEVGTSDLEDLGVTPAKIEPSGTDGEVLLTAGGAVAWAPAQNFAASDLTLTGQRTHNMAGNNLIFGGGGDVAIGTLPGAPQGKLDVDGQIRARNGFAASEGTAGNPGYGFFTNGDTDTGMYRINEDQLGFSTGGAEAMRIDAAQNVGIGTGATINVNAKLHVNGNVYAENGDFYSAGGIVIAGIPDYVFQKYFQGNSTIKPKYEFQNLEEIEKFVRKYHHLPGIKSFAEVKKDGYWNLSKSNIQNLEKIEELFLHTIEQEKKIKTLQSENDTLTEELDTIKKDLEEIKAMLKKSN